MHDEDAFLRAVQAAPDDRDLLLIYADWLDERGDSPRADFLRLREAMKKLPQEVQDYTVLWRRFHEIRLAIDGDWIRSLEHSQGTSIHVVGDGGGSDSPFLDPVLVDHIRRRPGMYFGGVEAREFHMLLFGLVEGVAYEMNGGRCSLVTVELHGNGNSRFSTDGMPLELVAGQIGLCGPATRCGWHVAPSVLGGIDPLKVVVACSDCCRIETVIDGVTWQQEFRSGQVAGDARRVGQAKMPLTAVTFRPDPNIFRGVTYNLAHVRGKLELVGHLSKGRWQATVIDERGAPASCSIPQGDLTTHLTALDTSPHQSSEIIDLCADSPDCWFHLALRWTDADDEGCWPYCNYYPLFPIGDVIDALRRAVGLSVRRALRARNEGGIQAGDYRSGLRMALSILARSPRFYGSTRARLSDPAIAAFVYREVRDGLIRYFNDHRAEADRVCARVLEAREQRLARRHADTSPR